MTDKDEFCEQVRRCEGAMYSLAYSVLRNEADAGEAVSEAIYRAYKNLDSLKSEAAFKPWILRIVHNTAAELVRRNAKLVPMEELEEAAGEGGESELATRLTLRAAVERLKQPYRTVVVLFYYEGLSAAKIAQITGTNIVAVRKQLSRAREALRESLKEDFR
ncbi:MAG: RNA polymerase sigma factor [Oscillospiraceae bacterium]